MANSIPASMRTSRARRAGKTLTMNSVVTVPNATGIMTKGTTVSTAVA